jgi:hypothetical protein
MDHRSGDRSVFLHVPLVRDCHATVFFVLSGVMVALRWRGTEEEGGGGTEGGGGAQVKARRKYLRSLVGRYLLAMVSFNDRRVLLDKTGQYFSDLFACRVSYKK